MRTVMLEISLMLYDTPYIGFRYRYTTTLPTKRLSSIFFNQRKVEKMGEYLHGRVPSYAVRIIR